jgi:hypothetical protein
VRKVHNSGCKRCGNWVVGDENCRCEVQNCGCERESVAGKKSKFWEDHGCRRCNIAGTGGAISWVGERRIGVAKVATLPVWEVQNSWC